MELRTSRFLVPFALGAMGFGVLFLSGCGKSEPAGEPSPQADPTSPAVYMKDEAFRQGLKDRNAAQRKIVAERAELVRRMDELSAAMRQKLGNAKPTAEGEDPAVLELQKLPEWKELEEKVKALNAKYEAGRKEILSYVRRRITPSRSRESETISK